MGGHDGGTGSSWDGTETRGRIISAALAAFADRGVEATSLDAIAGAVGVRKQTLLYWFPSKQQLLFGVIDHVVADLGDRLASAAAATSRGSSVTSRQDQRRLRLVDATFRLGATEPALLAMVREVVRLGPPATTRLVAATEPLVTGAVATLSVGRPDSPGPGAQRITQVLLSAAARVVGIVTEAEIRADLGLAVDRAWLRSRRRDLLDLLARELD